MFTLILLFLPLTFCPKQEINTKVCCSGTCCGSNEYIYIYIYFAIYSFTEGKTTNIKAILNLKSLQLVQHLELFSSSLLLHNVFGNNLGVENKVVANMAYATNAGSVRRTDFYEDHAPSDIALHA